MVAAEHDPELVEVAAGGEGELVEPMEVRSRRPITPELEGRGGGQQHGEESSGAGNNSGNSQGGGGGGSSSGGARVLHPPASDPLPRPARSNHNGTASSRGEGGRDTDILDSTGLRRAGSVSGVAGRAFARKDSAASKAYHEKRDITTEPHPSNQIRGAEPYFRTAAQSVSLGVVLGTVCVGALAGVFVRLRGGVVPFGLLAAGGGAGAAAEDAVIVDLVGSVVHVNPSFIYTLILLSCLVAVVVAGIVHATGEAQRRTEYAALYNVERARERWETENYLEGEVREMVGIYMQNGLSRPDAEKVIQTLSRYPEFFVDIMMKEELLMSPPDQGPHPALEAVARCLSFVLAGLVPLVPLVPAAFATETARFDECGVLLVRTAALCTVALFLSGVLRSMFSVQRWWAAGATVVLQGCLSAAVTFFVVGYAPMILESFRLRQAELLQHA